MDSLRDRVVARFKTADVQDDLKRLLDQSSGMSGAELAEALRGLAQKAERAPAPAAAPAAVTKKHPLNVGDLLECSWGYDQTNLDYYVVTKLLGVAMVEIREVATKIVGDSMTSNKVMPDPSRVVGAPLRKKVQPNGAVRITSFSSAYPWDGKPGWATKSEFGH